MTKIMCNKTKNYNKYFKFEIVGVFLIITLFACGNKKTIDQTSIENGQNNRENNITETKSTNPTEFYIKDETKYSENFISKFKKYFGMYETVSLIEDTIIVNNDIEGLIIIPTDLPLNKTVVYGKTEKEKEYILTVKRIYLATLEYNYYEIVNDKKINEKQGLADLPPSFILACAGTFEDENEMTYGMNEYIDNSEKGCWTYIYIGVGSIKKSFLVHGCDTNRNKFRTPELIRRK